MNQSRKWMYWVGLVTAGFLLCVGCWLSLQRGPLGWRFAWATLAIVPIAAIVQYAARIIAPGRIESLMDGLTYRQRFAVYWLHYLAMFGVFAAVIAFLCLDFVSGLDFHRVHYFLQWLWIDCIVLVACIADLCGQTANIWHPLKPTMPPEGENI